MKVNPKWDRYDQFEGTPEGARFLADQTRIEQSPNYNEVAGLDPVFPDEWPGIKSDYIHSDYLHVQWALWAQRDR